MTGPATASSARSPTVLSAGDRIRVAHTVHSLELGGAQQVIKYLVANGDKSRFDHVVYAGHSGVMHAELADAGAHIEVIKRHLPKVDPIWALRLARALRAAHIDVLHTHLFGDSLHGMVAARWAGAIPVVVTLHNSVADFSPLQRAGYRWILPRAACAVACAASAGESFREFLGTRDTPIEVIPNGLDPAAVPSGSAASSQVARAKLGLPPDAIVIGGFGRLVAQKNFALLVEAFATVVARMDGDLRLVIVGDGPQGDDLRRQAHAAGITDRVVFAGFRSNARELMAGVDVLAFSSRYEGLPMTLLEGMASKRCIVATAVPGLADVITDQEDGLLVSPATAARLADALGRAAGDPDLRARLGDAAREKFLARYTVDRMVTRYENLYRRILGDSPGRSKEKHNAP